MKEKLQQPLTPVVIDLALTGEKTIKDSSDAKDKPKINHSEKALDQDIIHISDDPENPTQVLGEEFMEWVRDGGLSF